MQTSKIKSQNSETAQKSNSKSSPYGLKERMARFGEDIIIFCLRLKADHISRPLINQFIRSATSVGANYAEANNASSKKDFRNKVHIAKKEAQETKHWLRRLKPYYPASAENLRIFWQEAHELTLILQSIINKLNMRTEN